MLFPGKAVDVKLMPKKKHIRRVRHCELPEHGLMLKKWSYRSWPILTQFIPLYCR